MLRSAKRACVQRTSLDDAIRYAASVSTIVKSTKRDPKGVVKSLTSLQPNLVEDHSAVELQMVLRRGQILPETADAAISSMLVNQIDIEGRLASVLCLERGTGAVVQVLLQVPEETVPLVVRCAYCSLGEGQRAADHLLSAGLGKKALVLRGRLQIEPRCTEGKHKYETPFVWLPPGEMISNIILW